MPLFYLRRLTGSERTERTDRHLAYYLAFVAGAVNAGGFLAVRQYTSHMSGIVSAIAYNLVLGSLPLVMSGVLSVMAFLFGAFVTTLCIRWARERGLESQYALPLAGEAFLLIVFGVVGRALADWHVLWAVVLLCFTMGMQNAIITKLSKARIRTTHLTGMVTDMGIALGRIVFKTSQMVEEETAADVGSLRLLGALVGLFFVGGVAGAFGFQRVGFFFTLPLAAGLLVLAAMPVVEDVRRLVERR